MEINWGALLDKSVFCLSGALDVIKRGITWVCAKAAPSILRKHPHIVAAAVVGISGVAITAAAIASGPALLRFLLKSLVNFWGFGPHGIVGGTSFHVVFPLVTC